MTIHGTTGPADSDVPVAGKVLGHSQLAKTPVPDTTTAVNIYGPPAPRQRRRATIGSGSVSLTGLTVGANNPTGATPFSIREPYLTMYYIIATNGIYPTRP